MDALKLRDLDLHDSIDIYSGVIDPDYSNELIVLTVNSSQNCFDIKQGDSIAEMILERSITPAIYLLSSLNIPTKGTRVGEGA